MSHPLDNIARVCHEVNRAYCAALGDHSQPTWEDAPEWQRASARMGVDLHLSGDFGPEASHIAWMQRKLDEGWRYGPTKNPEAKEHPCIVPFAELPREQQAKDFIFRSVVHALRPAPASTDTRELSFGERAVGLAFNPSGDPLMQSFKQKAADFIDEANALRLRSADSEVKRMASVAITEAQTAQMWAVKAITWRG